MKIELLMFDLDGTLVDSLDDIADQANFVLAAEGLPVASRQTIGGFVGRGPANLFRRLLGEENPSELSTRLAAAFERRYLDHVADRTTVYPGIFDALEHYRGIPKVIITNKGQVFADALADRLGFRPHFNAIFGAEAFERRKPDPMPLLEACRRFSAPAERSVLIGDSRFDVEAASGAGSLCVFASYGYGAHADLRELKPHFVISRASELIGLFS